MISISSSYGYIHLRYPTNETVDINVAEVKKLLYLLNTVTLVEVDDNTTELQYDDVEDPDSSGDSFSSADALWDWIMDRLNLVAVPIVNGVTHDAVQITHDTVEVTHT